MGRLIHVTEVLAPWTCLDGVPERILEAAKDRGSWVHAAISAHLQDLFVPEGPPEYAGYFESFLRFEPLIKKVLAVEKLFCDEVFGFCGTVDLLAEIVGMEGLCVVDWKTPVNHYPTWAGQLAAYKSLTYAKHAGTLQLREDGKSPKMIWHSSDLDALPAFLNALNAHKYFMKGVRANGAN